jgi:hypothetical protein
VNVRDFDVFADEPLHDVEIVNHQIKHDVDIQRARGELTDAMDLEIDGLANVRPQRNECRIETLEMAHLKNGIAFAGSTNHLIRFFERPRDRLFDENVNAGLEQSARDFTVHLGRHCEAGGIYLADQHAPISGPINFSFAAAFSANRAGSFFVQIADRDKFGQTLGSESRVDACMLAAKTTGSDDGCA